MIASHWGYKDMVSVLLSHKAEVNQQDVSHMIALCYSEKYNCILILHNHVSTV